MKNTLKIDHKNGIITMDRTFAKNAENTMSAEYAHLQSVRRDYPTYTVVRRTIKSNPHKECWKGLTYEYMKSYIATHEDDENRETVLREFAEMRLISQCHSRAYRYPVIKQWFLSKYPEISEHGMPAAEEASAASDMLRRLAQHYVGIQTASEHKYEILAEAKRKRHIVNFDVLYYAVELASNLIEEEIGEKEGEYIRAYMPALNTQIPKADNWHEYTVNKKAKTITLDEILAKANNPVAADFQ